MLDEFERMAQEREEAVARLREAWEVSPAVLQIEEGRYRQLLLLTPSTIEGVEPLRVSVLHEDGPVGHDYFNTVEGAARCYASSRKVPRPVDEDFVIAWCATKDWAEGIQKIEYVRLRNLLYAQAYKLPKPDRNAFLEKITQTTSCETYEEAIQELQRLKNLH